MKTTQTDTTKVYRVKTVQAGFEDRPSFSHPYLTLAGAKGQAKIYVRHSNNTVTVEESEVAWSEVLTVSE